MRSKWQLWRETQKAKLLTALLLGLLIAVVMPFVAKSISGQSEMTFLSFVLKKEGDLSVVLSPWVIAVILLWLLVGYLVLWPKHSSWEASEVNIEVAKIGKIVMKPNEEVAGIAHRAWAEIATRKAGVPFDEDHDVIEEVYDSWYQLFGEIRGLIKGVPVEKLRSNPDAQKLEELLLTLLNQVLRPHLTTYQARYRSWLEIHKAEHPEATPQDIQKLYPEYTQLVSGMRQTNSDCLDISNALKTISKGKQ